MSPLRLTFILVAVIAVGLGLSARGAVTCTVLANFGSTLNGLSPNQLVEGADGNYYGTAQSGGPAGFGTIFEVTPSGAVTTLYSFAGGTDGKTPLGRLALGTGSSAGTLFGTTSAGGASGVGTFFSITTGGTFTLLHGFNGASEGTTAPAFVVTGTDGNFYATTQGNSTGSTGSVFMQLTPAGVVTVLHTFASGTDGGLVNPQIVQGSDGAFYGTSQLGGSTGFGTIFRITTQGAFSVIGHNANADDIPILTTVGPAPNHLLYGYDTSNSTVGTIFSMTTAGVRTTFHQFSTDDNGGFGPTAFILGSDGNFYGETGLDGVKSTNPLTLYAGTFFQITPTGTFALLHGFADATETVTTLVQGSDGFLYADGLTSGTGGAGSIVQLSTAGAYNTLVSFSTPPSMPAAGLIQAADGNFYGTTTAGGAAQGGVIFAMSPSGTLLTLASFTNAVNGASPQYPLLQDPATGIIYGTTQGTSTEFTGFDGTYFHVQVPTLDFANAADPVNTVPIALDTPRSDSAPDPAGLVLGTPPAGITYQPFKFGPTTLTTPPTFFSTTLTGGDNSGGSLLAREANGTYATLYSFPETQGSTGAGSSPISPLIYDSAGNLYGAASTGGANGDGTIFKVAPSIGGAASTITDVYSFTDSNTPPTSNNLALGANGTIYGASAGGGQNRAGFVYSLTSSGTFTVLHNFDDTVVIGPGPEEFTDGAGPSGGLTLGKDGNLYGTTVGGSVGPQNNGIFYSISPTGTYTILYSFALTDGTFPVGKLVQGVDGNFYGVMQTGGAFGDGTVYRLNLNSGTTAQTITFPAIADHVITDNSVTLGATASSGLPVSYLVSGPVTLGGANNNVLTFTGTGTVTVTAGQPGNGTFAPATDVTRTFAITAAAGQTVDYAMWEAGFGVSTAPGVASQHDAIPDLLKYVFDINPAHPISAADRAALPTLGRDTTTNPGTTYLTLTYRQYNLSTGIHVNLQTSTNLQTWAAITPDMTQTLATTANDTTLKLFFNTQGATRQFLRLNVTMP